jgi:parvulin-like peptidyl-prolyl isomerase
MAKKGVQSSRGPTRKQIALSRRERERLRLVYMSLGLVGVLILIVLVFGLLQNFVFEPNAPIAIVNGLEIKTGDYRNRTLYERFILEDIYQQILTELAAIPEAEEGDQFTELLRNQYQQRGAQVAQQRSLVDRQTLDIMIAEKLIEVETQRRGIAVSAEEISEAINRFLAGRQGGLTGQAAAETNTVRAEASATAAAWTPTPTITPAPTLTTTAEITQPAATSINTPIPAPTPTLNVIDQGTLATQYTNWLDTLIEQTDTEEGEYREIMRLTLLREKLAEALGDEVPRLAEQSRARHILVETEEEVKAVIERLEAGEDFADLAQELSTDQGSAANGGDLGFAPQGRYVPSIDEAVFTLPVGQISEPLESQFGWHVVEVLEREERELSPVDYSQSQRLAFSDWLADAREAAEVEDFWSPEKSPEDPFLQQQF